MSTPEPTDVVKVAAVQMAPRLGDLDANREAIVARFTEATDADARLVVFPECALTGYCFADRDEAMRCALPIPDPGLLPLEAACARRNAYMVVGLLERDGDRLFNACALLGPEGVVGTYRKVHLPFMGVDRFTDPGDRPFAVHEAAGLRVGLHICYDGTFPEVGRVLAMRGADLLVLPTNWPAGMECGAEHVMNCRALENTVYALAANRVGEERGYRFIGRSSIAGPGGETLAAAGPEAEQTIYADIDPARARRKRLVRRPGEHEVDRIADRRPTFYGPLVEPNGRD